MWLKDNEEVLARQAQQGDREAFLTLYEHYLPKVFNRVKSKVPLQYAEDVTQEIFIAVVRSLAHFEQRSRFSTWLYTIVNRQIADFYRQRYRDHSNNQTIDLEDAENLAIPAVDDDYDQCDDRAAIQKGLHSLADHYQEVILMRFADGLTFAEIAEKRGQSLEATKSVYRRALQALRDQMGRV